MKASCQFCGNRWFLTPEAIHLAVENSPQKGKSIGVECTRCRKLVKLARPKRLPPLPAAEEPAEE